MSNLQILDCTLRDGGYCNDCHFGFENERKIINGLLEANIDIIECGFFFNNINYQKGYSRFTSLDQIKEIIPKNKNDKIFVILSDYGKFNVDDIPEYDGTSVDGFRITFHKKDMIPALKACKKIKEKGYKVFIQDMVSLNYTDEEFLDLINHVNEFEPYAFYIVDSFGTMKQKDLTRLFYLVEHNLKNTIKIGFHSHNNMQLAYSNAQSLIDKKTDRDLIIDSSIYGMGRGAGNLNTELFLQYVNENACGCYEIKPLLNIIDEILDEFYQRNPWGYSLPNYLSAAHNAHPNYAIYLDDKKTLTVENMNEIFDMMDDEKRFSYDKNYIEELYLRYMANGEVQEKHKEELKNILLNKKVLFIAPGKSSMDEKNKIKDFVLKENPLTISINFDYKEIKTDFIFLSNLRRFRELDKDKRSNCIVTSNIPADNVYLQTKYYDLLTNIDSVRDNAGLMAIKFFMNYGLKEVYLAGFDGYTHDVRENYGDKHMTYYTKNAVLDAMNEGMIEVLKEYSRKIKIIFLTEQKYIHLGDE